MADASITVDLSADEARVLMALLDVAVKAAGLQAAEGALAIAAKVQAAIKEDGRKEQADA